MFTKSDKELDKVLEKPMFVYRKVLLQFKESESHYEKSLLIIFLYYMLAVIPANTSMWIIQKIAIYSGLFV